MNADLRKHKEIEWGSYLASATLDFQSRKYTNMSAFASDSCILSAMHGWTMEQILKPPYEGPRVAKLGESR